MLEAQQLTARRGNRTLFQALSLAATPGSLTLIQGPNGSGKTTLLRALAGLTPPERGSISWRGEDIKSRQPAYHSELCYLGHAPAIKMELTALENLRLAAQLRGRSLTAPAEALARAGLGNRLNIPCRALSAGQRRRAALARLLMEPATLWLLDEPLTALDAAATDMLSGWLTEHAGRGGITVMSSHQPLTPVGIAVQHLRLGDA